MTLRIERLIRYQFEPIEIWISKVEKYVSDSGEFAVIKPKADAIRINKPPVDSRRKKSRNGEMREFISVL
jgi:hypothetical protein